MSFNNIASLHIRGVPVPDQGEALAFYTTLLGQVHYAYESAR